MASGNSDKIDSSGDIDIIEFIKEKYGEAATMASRGKQASCCGGTCADRITSNLYSQPEVEAVPNEALLASLGCANPVALAELNPGEVVWISAVVVALMSCFLPSVSVRTGRFTV